MRKLCGNGIKILIIIFSVVTAILGLRLIMSNTDTAHAVTGDGREESPYVLESAQDLLWLAENVNEGKNDGYYGTYFKLNCDIDLTSLYSQTFGEWIPIGNSVYPFKGNFDGCGFAVTGLKTFGEKDVNGLFGYTNINAVIKNVTVYGEIEGANYSAGIVGYNAGRIENCVNYATVTVINDALRVGGIAGFNSGELVYCENKALISANLSTIIGGIVGANSGTIEKCVNKGEIITQSSIVGGIVGFNFDSATVSECINAAEISGKSTVGGIAGDNKASVEYNCNFSDINTINGTAGGIVGNNAEDGVVLHSFSVSNVTGNYDIAALCGYNQGIVSNSFYNTDAFAGDGGNGNDLSKCKGLTTLQMTQWDALENDDVMGGLSEKGSDIWVKEDFNDHSCYYPQLKFLYENNAEISKELSAVQRICPDESEILLSAETFIYGDCEYKPEIYFNDYLLISDYDYTAEYSDNVLVGQAAVEISFINGFSGKITKNFEILPKEVFIEWIEEEFCYNGGQQFPHARIISGIIEGQSVTLDYIAEEAVNAGKYDVEAVLADSKTNQNYILSKSVFSYEILRKNLKIDWADSQFFYNGEIQYPVVEKVHGNLDGEIIYFDYDFGENVDAGEYSVTAKLKENDVNSNYDFAPEAFIYEICKQQLILDWEGCEFFYNGSIQFPNAVISNGIINGEEVEISYDGYENNIAAEAENGYRVIAFLTDNPVNKNYYIYNEIYFYSIFKSPLIIEWWDTPLYYNGEGQAPGFYIVSGRIGNDIPEFSVSDYSENNEVSVGGKYKVYISLADTQVNANYSFVPQEKYYDIVKAEFDVHTLSFKDKCYFYDGNAKNVFVEGDLPFGMSVEYLNNGATEIGEHTVTAILIFDSKCYNVSGEPTFTANLKIAQASFDYLPYGLNFKLTGSPIYDLNMEVSAGNKKSVSVNFKKSVLSYYNIGFVGEDGEYAEKAEVSVRLNSKQLKKKGLYVVYYNSDGETIVPEFNICDGVLTFEADAITGFAIVCNKDFTLYIVLPVIALMLIAAVTTVCILIRNKKKKAGVSALSLVEEEEAVADCSEEFTPQINVENTVVNAVNEGEFTDVPFEFDGVRCASYEWFLKSLKFKTKKKQIAICGGDEYSLKLFEAISESSVYWQGKKYKIGSKRYYELLQRAKDTLVNKI